MNKLKERLLNKIQNQEVRMVPRWQETLKALLWGFTAVLIGLISVYLLSFIFFIFYRSGIALAPFYGWHGVLIFLSSSPWLLIGVLGLFLLTLYVLVTHYSFSYQKPLLYTIIALVCGVIVLSTVVQGAQIHQKIELFSEHRPIAGLAPLYKGIENRRPEGVLVGVITSFEDEYITVQTLEGKEFFVTLIPQTKYLPEELKNGSLVIVIGERTGDTVVAYGIRSFEEKRLSPHHFNKLKARGI